MWYYQVCQRQGKEIFHSIKIRGRYYEKYLPLSCIYSNINKIRDAIESLHPETKVWETCTPYFEKRNVHFYVNRCGFHIVEFYNKKHPDPNTPDEYEKKEGKENEYFEGMFRFEKVMI